MKNNSISIFAGLLATSTLALAAVPAEASTCLGLNYTPTPGTAIHNTSGAILDPYTISYETSTFMGDGKTYEFSVLTPDGLGSRGMKLSTFGFLVNNSTFSPVFTETKPYDTGSKGNTNDWLGTCKTGTIVPCTVKYTFAKDVKYQLVLSPDYQKKLKTYGVYQKDSYTFDLLSDEVKAMTTTTVSELGAYFLGIEDGQYNSPKGGKYSDFQDWVVKVKAVPEPGAVGGLLGLGVLGLIGLSRKSAKN